MLTDLKYSKADIKEETAEFKSPEMPEYPWGLQIRLEDEELQKLGVKNLPQVGAEYHMTVIAHVTSVSQTQMADGDEDRCVCLQITMASIDSEGSAEEEAREKKQGKETPRYEAAEGRRSIL